MTFVHPEHTYQVAAHPHSFYLADFYCGSHRSHLDQGCVRKHGVIHSVNSNTNHSSRQATTAFNSDNWIDVGKPNRRAPAFEESNMRTMRNNDQTLGKIA